MQTGSDGSRLVANIDSIQSHGGDALLIALHIPNVPWYYQAGFYGHKCYTGTTYPHVILVIN